MERSVESSHVDSQRCYLLIQLVMEFARYMFALLFLRHDQSPCQILDADMTLHEVFFRTFTLGDIAHHTDQTLRSSIDAKIKTPRNLNPADLPISTLEATRSVEYLPKLHARTQSPLKLTGIIRSEIALKELRHVDWTFLAWLPKDFVDFFILPNCAVTHHIPFKNPQPCRPSRET